MMKQWMLILGLAAIGCSEQKFHSVADGAGSEGPQIQVDPSMLDFGRLREGESKTKSFVISSVGEADLVLDHVKFSGEVAGFTLLTEGLRGKTLPPGSSETVEVVYTPMGASEFAQAIITSNDADRGDEQQSVELLGEGSVPELNINPDPLDMGVTYVGCDNDNEVSLENIGTDTLEIYEISHEGSAILMSGSPELPLVLEPGEAQSVYFSYSPSAEVEDEGMLTVLSNEPLEVREASQLGEGEFAAAYEDTWLVPADPPSDIVFFVDQSCSMDDDQARLAANFSTFITELNTYSEDWQIIVANKDDGCNSTSGVLTPSTGGYISRFQSAVSDGSDGAWGFFYTEAGLTVTSEAIENTDPGECNHGFLRPSAMLHIIMVSDEPEQSPMNWSHYVDKVVAKKGSVANVKFSAIAGDYPVSTCTSAEPGTGYYEAVTATGGIFSSICGDWSDPATLSMLAAASVQQSAFELSATPVVASVRVFVNGSERLSGWFFDGPTNTVYFEEAIPDEGDRIRIEYGGLAVCD
jgi:hypothetical protein